MRLAISNLAWEPHEREGVRNLLGRLGVCGVEIAPTKVWDDPVAVTRAKAEEYRSFWGEYGIEVVAMQSLLYGRPELVLFESGTAREDLLRHLEALCRLSSWLGLRPLVFGSPRNRWRGELSHLEAEGLAISFFRRAGAIAAEHGVVLCIEANPPEYGCNFVTGLEEAEGLVEAVGHPGFALHLDTGGMMISGEFEPKLLWRAASKAQHVHISEPFLAETGTAETHHAAVASALRDAGYARWTSIEMRAGGKDNVAQVERAILAASEYCRVVP